MAWCRFRPDIDLSGAAALRWLRVISAVRRRHDWLIISAWPVEVASGAVDMVECGIWS